MIPRAAVGLFIAALTAGAQSTVHFRPVQEPKETAFTILVPAGWQYEGGVLRINPLATDGPVNTIGAKFDFAVKRDPAGSAVIHWLPSITYQDPRHLAMPAPIGATYRSMPVYQLMRPSSS